MIVKHSRVMCTRIFKCLLFLHTTHKHNKHSLLWIFFLSLSLSLFRSMHVYLYVVCASLSRRQRCRRRRVFLRVPVYRQKCTQKTKHGSTFMRVQTALFAAANSSALSISGKPFHRKHTIHSYVCSTFLIPL